MEKFNYHYLCDIDFFSKHNFGCTIDENQEKVKDRIQELLPMLIEINREKGFEFGVISV